MGTERQLRGEPVGAAGLGDAAADGPSVPQLPADAAHPQHAPALGDGPDDPCPDRDAARPMNPSLNDP
jgi:hypothetical protein